MSPTEFLLSLLPSAKPHGSGWLACCPAHQDRSPSLSVSEGDKGRALLKCFAGCTTDAVLKALNLKAADLFSQRIDQKGATFPNSKRSKSKRNSFTKDAKYETPEAAVSSLVAIHGQSAGRWTYHDENRLPVAMILRFDRSDGSKDFRPVSLQPDGCWKIAAPSKPRPLYGLPDVVQAEIVFVCEGEKAADAIRSLGLVATTSMNGAQSPESTDWTPLIGKIIVILPDNDEAGRRYAESVTEILQRLNPRSQIKIVDLPGIPDRGDAVEWLESFEQSASVETMKAELFRLTDGTSQIQFERVEFDAMGFEVFPVEVFPEPIRSFVKCGARALRVDPSFIALPVLSMLGSCIGNTRRILIKSGWSEPPIIWSVIVGNSGACKSPALEMALKPLKDKQRDAFKVYADSMTEFEAAKSIYERDADRWKKGKPKYPTAERLD